MNENENKNEDSMYSSNINVGTTGNNNASSTSYQSQSSYDGGYTNGNANGNTSEQSYHYDTPNASNTTGSQNYSRTYQRDYKDAYGNTYGNAYGNAYGNNYNNTYGSAQNTKAPKTPKPKKPFKLNGFGKKVAICVSLGLFFGIFAGVSFFAVNSITKYVESNQAAVSAGATAGADTSESNANNQIAEAQQTTPATTSETPLTTVTDVTQVVDNVMPSVVSVTNNFMQKQQDFFGQTTESEQTASGSGIIVGESDTELLIATNYHVVEGADSLKVQFIDGTEADAQMKGSDSGMDLAVMAVQLDTLSDSTKNAIVIAKMGDSDSLKVGEPAIAIGNALGIGQSVTTGVISAVNRSIVSDDQVTPTGTGSKSGTSLIQTDAAINPGNSGGALLNINGEVVGINSNKIGGSVIEGMGYAIPISNAKPIIEDLMTKTTKIKAADGEKAYLGISGVDVTADAASTYGLPEGVYVAQVYDDTAASNAGIVKGDIITKFDGSSVGSMEELQNALQYYSAGTTVEITIQQGSPSGYQEKTLSITLGTKPDQQVQ